MTQTTRGELTAARLVNCSSGQAVHCMFNPHEYTLTKRNAWETKPVKGKNVPKVSFRSGGSQVLKLRLHFDTLSEQSDVRDITDELWKMMMVETRTRNQRSGKSQPPDVEFCWGKLRFKAVLTNLSQKFLLFIRDGVPVRCTVDITLEQFVDVDDYSSQDADAGESATPGTTGRQVTTVQGDRLDNTIAAGQGDPNTMRQVAEENNIDDPLRIPPGTPVTVRTG